MPYQIKNWNDHFEVAKSRTMVKKPWCSIPTKQDGLGYGLIMREPDGPAVYGAFVALVLMCAKQPAPRCGWITESGQPTSRSLSPLEISIKTQMPESIIERMLEVTTSDRVGWVKDTKRIPKGHLEDTTIPRSIHIGEEIEEIKGDTGEEGDYPCRLQVLKNEKTIENAIAAVCAGHDAFSSVPSIHLENSFKSQPDRDRWPEAIEGLVAAYAGADLPRPNKTLINWLQGKAAASKQEIPDL